MKHVFRKALAQTLFGALAMALWWATAAHSSEPAHRVSHAAEPAATASPPARTEIELLRQRHEAAFLLALKEQVCLMTSGCATDEGRMLDALETCKRVEADLASRADAGSTEAALARGLIALRRAESHSSRSLAETEAQFPGAVSVLRRRWAQETQVGERYLSMAAQRGHPRACLALAEHLGARVPQPEPNLVSHLFLCAVTGLDAQGDRAGAIGAYAKMRAAVPSTDPLLLGAHVVIYRLQAPERPWRQVEPADAMSIRKAAIP